MYDACYAIRLCETSGDLSSEVVAISPDYTKSLLHAERCRNPAHSAFGGIRENFDLPGLQVWEDYYNFNRPHGSLGGKAPYEVLIEKLLIGHNVSQEV